uniref:Transposase n=1 Tax=Ascaris lumbricoides TaxID=6252 RepID=A0A0M3IGA8_ASCLU
MRCGLSKAVRRIICPCSTQRQVQIAGFAQRHGLTQRVDQLQVIFRLILH